MRNFDHRFPLKSGVQIYVQDTASRRSGEKLCDWVDSRWKPPAHFYHFRSGGHVAAARLHQYSQNILGLDLRRFFSQVTRTKVHRALRRIGFSSAEAYDLACESTVAHDGTNSTYSLPFGFVQSMHLASLALHYSALGRAMLNVRKTGVILSTYVDDVILSADDLALLVDAQAALTVGAHASGFAFNLEKTRGPANIVSAFNLWVGRNELRVVDNRLNEFRQTVMQPPEAPADATIAYVRTVNAHQAADLVAARVAAGL